jgi:hypothetical protein
MKFRKYIAYHNDYTFIIDEVISNEMAELYILKNNKVQFDYCQNSIQICKEQAFEDYNVPFESWSELTDLNEYPWLKD